MRRLAERALERGIVQEARGDIAQALTSYDEAVRTDSTLGAAALRLGALRERLGDRAEAELLYEHAVAAQETRAEGILRRALLRSLRSGVCEARRLGGVGGASPRSTPRRSAGWYAKRDCGGGPAIWRTL